ncbi:DUF262 domain-containing protein [Rhizobium bangladeshense]|uniref:DUF262 domain-containing protein n=1 Tax=Rhizobium bangladeshense TaxID=1138189 RepID=UPI001C83EDDF|nr:DUF262 domain-containing HNH endonuclease family protein [Rhizobium bangladeshense]MBX4899814.1 DUF262 domain-containing protein [Rhizobium bangladeshense]
MDSKLKVTDVPEEANFYDLVAGDNVLEIPLFQRPYMWKESHYKALLQDISLIDEETNGAVFLGVIVSFGRGSGPGRPPTWMIVDGQQRVTTLYLSVMAAVEVAAKAGELDWASDIMGRYLLVRPMSGLSVNTKLVPSFNDRGQFDAIWKRIITVKNFSSHTIVASNPPRAPAPTGAAEGLMLSQYMRIRSEMTRLLREQGISGLNHHVEILTSRLSVVSISLRDPTVAPKIFERLNYGAEPVTVADLVRNEVFARSGDDASTAMHLFGTRWEPFVARFADKNADLDRFLFPYGLIYNPNIKKADLFAALRKIWDKFSGPEQIIEDLEQFQPAYLALTAGENYQDGHPALNLRVGRIYRSGRPSSIYPFLLKLLRAFELGDVSESATCGVLDAIESFLFRRAVVGIEPTGLHAVFKGLWQELTSEPQGKGLDELLTPERLRSVVRSKPTISWPSDEEFRVGIESGELYRRKIATYAIREYELGLEGESPSDIHQIEHIAPQSATENWKAAIPEGYEKLVHTWGNLLPLTSSMNPSTGQSDFAIKRTAYADSIFASAREVAKHHEWNATAIRDRSKLIADWALTRWRF